MPASLSSLTEYGAPQRPRALHARGQRPGQRKCASSSQLRTYRAHIAPNRSKISRRTRELEVRAIRKTQLRDNTGGTGPRYAPGQRRASEMSIFYVGNKWERSLLLN